MGFLLVLGEEMVNLSKIEMLLVNPVSEICWVSHILVLSLKLGATFLDSSGP